MRAASITIAEITILRHPEIRKVSQQKFGISVQYFLIFRPAVSDTLPPGQKKKLHQMGITDILFIETDPQLFKGIPVLQRKGGILAELNWWLMAWDMDPAWKGGHGGAEVTAAILGIDPSLVDQSEVAGPMRLHDVSDTLKATGFTSIDYKGVTVNIPRLTPSVTHNGWIGPDHPETATEEWGRKMLQTTADYIVDFMEEFKKVDIAKACGTEF